MYAGRNTAGALAVGEKDERNNDASRKEMEGVKADVRERGCLRKWRTKKRTLGKKQRP